jgi:hypothetical protein
MSYLTTTAEYPVAQQTFDLTNVDDKAGYIMANLRLPVATQVINFKLILLGSQAEHKVKELIHYLNYNTYRYYFRWTKGSDKKVFYEVFMEVKPIVDHLEQQSSYLAARVYNDLVETEKAVERVQFYKPLFFSKKEWIDKNTSKFVLEPVLNKLLDKLPQDWDLSYDILNETDIKLTLVFHITRVQ